MQFRAFKYSFGLVTLFCAGLSGHHAYAASTSAHALSKLTKDTVKMETAVPITPSESQSTLALQTSQYVSSGQNFFREDATNNNSSIALTLNRHDRWHKLEGRTFLKDEYSAGERWNYLNVYELYAAVPIAANSHFYFGRKLERWNEWESEWGQGVFQPRYMQNKLRPEQAGLFGMFLKSETKSTSLTFGFLPVFIPDFGPHFFTSEYHFVSSNPWFLPPATQFVLPNNQGDIRYSLNSPEPGKVLNNPGIAGKFEWRSGRELTRVAAAYKPMPQLLLGFPSFHRMVITPNQDYMSVEVNARWVYHQVLSVDQVVGLGAWTVQMSFTHEQPLSGNGPSDWTSQQVKPAKIWAIDVSRPLEEEGLSATRLKFGFLDVEGGDARDRGEFAENKTMFERRYQFLEAYKVGLSKPWRGYFRFPLETEVSFIYDRKQNGGIFSLSSGLNLTRQLRADLQIDLLGLLGAGAETEDGFLAAYRANDRVGLGMSYVF